ncbi:amidase family protein [Actinomadura nitritigenes]|uniref:amidase n=1 Tax=Actinomadura nitritigenes TaxID=134602 RepID=UPI001FB7B3FE|nr:amidase [Actinomadura nitritigenes]
MFSSVLELARAVRAREVSSREVVEGVLHRIGAVNPELNAIRVVLADEALAAADGADRRLAAGEEVGPLHGVPFTVKENLDLAGNATTRGFAGLGQALASADAPIVAGLRAAGAIPIGRTNMSEAGFRYHTTSGIGGTTLNPWDRARTPGGSSGGDAVALVTGMTALGIANDLGGSLRFPAQCCGVASLKPSFGRIAAHSEAAAELPMSLQLLQANGPMARRVADLRPAFAAACRADPRDPWQVPVPLEGPPLSRPIGVALTLWDGVDPQVESGVLRAAQVLAEAGYTVQEDEPPQVDRAVELWNILAASEFRWAWQRLGPLASEELRTVVEDGYFHLFPAPDPVAHGMAYGARKSVAAQWARFQAESPLILAPVCAQPPFPVGWDLKVPDTTEELITAMRMVLPVNVLGLPAVTVPVGVRDGLPQAVQIIGPRFREDLCLDAAETIETVLGIHDTPLYRQLQDG